MEVDVPVLQLHVVIAGGQIDPARGDRLAVRRLQHSQSSLAVEQGGELALVIGRAVQRHGNRGREVAGPDRPRAASFSPRRPRRGREGGPAAPPRRGPPPPAGTRSPPPWPRSG